MKILKFGGTSVSSKKGLKTLINVLKIEKENNPVLVVSAISGVTDLLLSLDQKNKVEREKSLKQIKKIHLDLARELFKTIPADYIKLLESEILEINKLFGKNNIDNILKDKIVSYGEILSTNLITDYLIYSGIKSKQVIATSFIITNENFGFAEFIPSITKKKTRKVLLPILKNNEIPVVTGFIAKTKSGNVTTFGRGGSDYTAAIIGFSLGAEEIQIWTDVDGIFTTDPRKYDKAKVLEVLSFREASELAAFGAKVLHPRTIRPAINAGIRVRVLNTFNSNSSGTLIEENSNGTNHVVAIAAKKNITLINLYSTEMLFSKGFLSRVFDVFSKHNLSIDLVSVSEVSVSVSLDNDENLNKVIKDLEKFATITTTKEFGVVSLIGEGIENVENILKDIFTELNKKEINVKMISLGATDINISLVIPSNKIDNTISTLHKLIIEE